MEYVLNNFHYLLYLMLDQKQTLLETKFVVKVLNELKSIKQSNKLFIWEWKIYIKLGVHMKSCINL